MISIKGHNSVTNQLKMTGNNHNLENVNRNAYTKFGEVPQIQSGNEISDIYDYVTKKAKTGRLQIPN